MQPRAVGAIEVVLCPCEHVFDVMHQELLKHEADALVLMALDQVARLYNVRGSDIPFNPVLVSLSCVCVCVCVCVPARESKVLNAINQFRK